MRQLQDLISDLLQVSSNSLAAKIGLKPNDFLNSIAGMEVFQMTHEEVMMMMRIMIIMTMYLQAERAIMAAGSRFNMVIER